MKKIRKLSMGRQFSNPNFDWFEKEIIKHEIGNAFKEFMSHYASMSLKECIYSKDNKKWKVKKYLDYHWSITHTQMYIEKGYGKKMFFAISNEDKFFCVSFEKDTFGKVVLINFLKQRYYYDALTIMEQIKLNENEKKEIIVADSFEEFIWGLKSDSGEAKLKVYHYCDNGRKKSFKYIKEFGIIPRMFEDEFQVVEKELDVELPHYYKEVMKRYSGIPFMENEYSIKGKKYEVEPFFNLSKTIGGLEMVLDNPHCGKLLPFSSLMFPVMYCISLEKINFGEILYYNDRDGDYGNTLIKKVADSLEDFLYGLKAPTEINRCFYDLNYCDEDLIF